MRTVGQREDGKYREVVSDRGHRSLFAVLTCRLCVKNIWVSADQLKGLSCYIINMRLLLQLGTCDELFWAVPLFDSTVCEWRNTYSIAMVRKMEIAREMVRGETDIFEER